ncbi:MAG TPA: adenylosuccinate lyase [Actinomycetota bacterium]|nr:adenylosuccinate lyase [Actinomycetota bacterium]
MIDRYTRPEMAAVWSEERKFGHWLRVELLAVEARVKDGQVPAEEFEELERKASFDIERIKDLEKKTRHDVAAFVDNVAEIAGPSGRHLHYGMTSSDVLDTALALQMREAADLLLEGIDQLLGILISRAKEHTSTLMAFRTHGIHAEPGTLGIKIAGWAFELARGRERLVAARREIAVGKLSGAVGTYSQLHQGIEAFVMQALDLEPDEASTQVVSRDRHAAFLASLGIIAGSIERIATEIRHLARTEVAEVEEPFAEKEQKGSSAMPHKRNPWRCERLTGLARIVRAAVVPGIENIALWHERDISHSSVERVMLPDSCIVLDFMLAECTELVGGMVVYPDRMRLNIERSYGLLFSQTALLSLVDSGFSRDEAYRIVQEAAMKAWKSGASFKELLAADPQVRDRLSSADIDRCFDETRYLEHAGQIVARLDRLEK